ncbi:MAG: HAD-IC family P-type ATPase [Candidatus Shapirobacteria bacterium]|nr:HAD-IC family P-type ATPase [Candidatus Shapirobacteria bacterium]MDD3002744.1 HAD-IC family P-type ATPase [Candidatus Shapirobacteria bacterium]MDD4383470.1 HAD-IC family P-type ATPase [Candidatus Shapirobacteria bacterium]
MIYHGLSKNEVVELQKKYGKNILPIKDSFSRPLIFFSQFKSPLVYILIIVAIISLLFGEFFDASLVAIVIFVNALMGYYQELSSQKTLVSLRNILQPTALVIRNGSRHEINIQELVPGDIIALNAGDKIPGDGILLDGISLLVDESILTGESKAIEISSSDKNSPGLLRMGTTVLSGKGIMKIEKIGIETEMGKIGKSLSEIIDEKTPLQKKLEVFSNQLARIIIVVCSVIFLVEIFHHLNLWEALRLSLILSVAAIPEGLPIAVTVILAIGMKKILKKKGLVKKLLSIETLGSTSVICTDKTGTLTEGKMKVVKTNFEDEIKAQLSMILANEQRDSLELALWDFVQKKGQLNPKKILESTLKIYEEPFDSIKKYSLTIAKSGGKETAYIIGAAEIVLSFCDISKNEKQKILKEIETSANSGLKVLGMAYKEIGNLKKTEKFIWLGLCGIEDPLRPGVKETIKKALSAGINIKIVTGDYRKTAEEIARQLGFDVNSKNSIEGVEIESMSDTNLSEKINQIIIFSRITPQQKLRIVEILQKKGEIVAMTGDGVNDAPALKKANIGVVIGTGTEVAKEAGDLILLDGNFDTIVSAVEEGRRIFSNIKKVVVYVLSNSFVEIFLIFGTTLLNLPIPLTIVQILWIHLICDGPPDIALGFEPKETDLMKQLPKTIRNEKILSPKMKLLIFAISFLIGGLSLFIFNYFAISSGNLILGRTLVFAIAATVSLIYIFSFKNLKKPIIKTENFFDNKVLFFSVLYGFILIFAAIYVPFLNQILGTVPLNLFHWIIVFSVGIFATLIVEISKIF